MNRRRRHPLYIPRVYLRKALARAAAALSVLAAGWWAMRPLEQPDLSLPAVPDAPGTDLSPVGEPAMLAALDDSAFHVPLWFSPPPPPPSSAPSVESQPAPLPPFKLQLLAIVREPGAAGANDRFKALLYDPDTDKILEAAAGQSIGERTVVGITEREITLSDRAGTRTLSLRPAAADAAGGGS